MDLEMNFKQCRIGILCCGLNVFCITEVINLNPEFYVELRILMPGYSY